MPYCPGNYNIVTKLLRVGMDGWFHTGDIRNIVGQKIRGYFNDFIIVRINKNPRGDIIINKLEIPLLEILPDNATVDVYQRIMG